MRLLPAAAWLAILAGTCAFAAPPAPESAATPAATPAAAAASAPASLPRIVVTFANPPSRPPGPAGASGTYYGGTGYLAGQGALREAHRVAAAYSLREVASWPIQLLSVHCVVFEITNGRPVADVLAALSKDSRVALAQPLQEFHTLTDAAPSPPAYNDPLYDLQTNLDTLGIAQAHARTQGSGVRVALIDTAVDRNHPDLRGRIVGTHSFVPSPAPSGSAERHGTAMAGVIAAVANNHIGIVGIAPLAQVEVFEACWQLAPAQDSAACNTFTLARAIAAAIASGDPLVNLSVAGPADPLLTALVQAGEKRGATFVGAAAGAEAPFPTAISGVITAAASEQPLPAGAVGAPAQHVMTLRPGGEYDFASGTSVSAAEITGVIALLMSASGGHLASADALALLQGGGHSGNAAPPANAAVDVNAALARLDAAQSGTAVAARGTQL
jgi:subtilisin family serine protease